MRYDEELMRRIGGHDEEAFEALYARHLPRIHRHLLAMLHDVDAAEDLAQETFLRVWTRAEGWDGRGACLGWLLRIATNLALNQLRTVKRRRELPLNEVDDDSATSGWLVDAASLGPEAVCEQAEQDARLRQLMRALPEEKREVLRLVHEEEMDLHDVAATLGIPEGTVKSRLHYARKYLAREWRDE